MTVVIDASSAIEIALNNTFAPIFQEILNDADLVLAPDTFPAEVANAFWKYGNLSNLAIDTCQRGIDYCLDLVDDYIRTQHLCREVFSESIRSKLSAYDVFYLVVARRHDAVILTRDKKLIETATALNVVVARPFRSHRSP
ncbi:MAG TPA: type II toxin-antitoxin system VapC family toxin [Spirochaetia bacterium]|nr:type II toxin-antitoxin system VapC family toxin [Spirochaetia bacterium]